MFLLINKCYSVENNPETWIRIVEFIEEYLPIQNRSEYSMWLLHGSTNKIFWYTKKLIHHHMSLEKHTSHNYLATIKHIRHAVRRARSYCTAKHLYNQHEHKPTDIHKLNNNESYIRDNTRYKYTPCGSLDHLTIGTISVKNRRKYYYYEITVLRIFNIVLTVNTFISVHSIIINNTVSQTSCEQEGLIILSKEERFMSICSCHKPTSYHLSTSEASILLYDPYIVENTYLSITYQIKYSDFEIQTRQKFVFKSKSTINQYMSFTTAHIFDVLNLIHFHDFFVFHIIAGIIETVNVYLYRVTNCTLPYTLYKIIDGPITVEDSYLCDDISKIHLYENSTIPKELFSTYKGKSWYIKVIYVTVMLFSGYAFHFTYNTSVIVSYNSVPINITYNNSTHWITVNSSEDKIYHKAWHYKGDSFLVLTMEALRRFVGLDGGCLYGGFAIKQFTSDTVKITIKEQFCSV